MILTDLVKSVQPVSMHGDLTLEVDHVDRDTRRVGPGGLFVAIRGARVDDHDLVDTLDPSVVVVAETPPPAGTLRTWIQVADTLQALPKLAARVVNDPSHTLPVVAVTGTNGKTTVTTLLAQLADQLQLGGGYIGTVGSAARGQRLPSTLTTPEAPELHRLLKQMLERQVAVAAIEASSIGLVRHRLDETRVTLAIFTNLGRDHLDAHGTVERYAEAKALLFTELLRPHGGAPRALMCADDPWWSKMNAPDDHWTYGFAPDADVSVREWSTDPDGSVFTLETPSGVATFRSSLVGRHNVQNLAAVVGAGLLLGWPLQAMVKALPAVRGPAGRMQKVANDREILVLVDYAHTPDALSAALASCKTAGNGRIWVVFGCGGDRDQTKRPEMGRCALQADRVVLTSDNPRSEDAAQIAADVLAGLGTQASRVHVELDRRAAIAHALGGASAGDVVLIAGKGHESTQEIAGVKHPFDDVEVARSILEGR